MAPQPDFSQVHVNVPLTNVSVAYQQQTQDFIADKVFPQVPVSNQGGLYFQYLKEDWFRIEAQERAPVTESAGGGYDLTTHPYFCRVNAIHKDIDDQTIANANAVFDLERDATQWVTGQLLRKREKDFVTGFLKPGIWGLDLVPSQLAGGQPWDNVNSTPIEDIAELMLQIGSTTGFTPNVLVLGARTHAKVLNNSEIVNRVKFSGSGFPTDQVLAQAFNVDRILVARAIQNSQPKFNPSAGGVFDFMFGNGAFLGYTPQASGLMTAASGYIFTWSGLLGSGAYGTRMKNFRMENLEANRIEGENAYSMAVVGPDLGALLSNLVST